MMFFVVKTSAQISFVGFDTTICASPMTNVYTYSNYAIGFHGDGYNIYRNGTLIFNSYGTYSGEVWCLDLIAINDSTVFYVERSGGSYCELYKTSDYGQHWHFVSQTVGNYYGMYILNEKFGYIVTGAWAVNVTKFNDLWPQTVLISDTTLDYDIYKTDTIIGNSLCNIDSLKIFMKNGVDTITYHINFHIIPAGINTYSDAANKFSISPNPNNGSFKINTNKEYKNISIEITDVIGQTVFATKEKETSTINVTFNQPPGLYFINIIADGKRQVMKVVKE